MLSYNTPRISTWAITAPPPSIPIVFVIHLLLFIDWRALINTFGHCCLNNAWSTPATHFAYGISQQMKEYSCRWGKTMYNSTHIWSVFVYTDIYLQTFPLFHLFLINTFKGFSQQRSKVRHGLLCASTTDKHTDSRARTSVQLLIFIYLFYSRKTNECLSLWCGFAHWNFLHLIVQLRRNVINVISEGRQHSDVLPSSGQSL